ncbi:MAG: DUF1580 domain-containing protein [Candidatus Paceibacterota bacterium]
MTTTPTKKLRPLVEAIDIATGRQPHLSTCMRWCTRGIKGVKLASWMVGGRRLTTVEAVHAFVAKTTAASERQFPHSQNSTYQAAMQRLNDEGI